MQRMEQVSVLFWIYEKHYGSKMDRNHIRQRLEKIKLKKFMQHIVGVSRIWFVGTESNLLDEKRAEYIFANCTYFASAI